MEAKERKERLGWVLKAMRKLDDELTPTTWETITESGLDWVFLRLHDEVLLAIARVQKEVT